MNVRLPIAAALLSLVAEAPGASQQATFSAKVESVRVDVLVTDRSQPVLGLGTADFEVIDNGVPQQVEFVSYDQIPLNVILALDTSDSLAGERLDHLRGAGTALLAGLKTRDQAALVTFSNRIGLGSALTTDLGPVREAIEDVTGIGDTSLVDGAYAGIMVGESDAGRALLIVFSDGLDTISWLTPAAVLDTARRSDVVAYGVSIGRAKAEFLRELTSLTGGRLFEVEKTANLGGTFLGILEEFRHRYLVSYTPRGVARDGWHKLDVRLKTRKGTVKARPGYLAGQ